MTAPQLALLRQAIKDGGEIIIGSSDQTIPAPNIRVVKRLCDEGYLVYQVSGRYGRFVWHITNNGRIAAAKGLIG